MYICICKILYECEGKIAYEVTECARAARPSLSRGTHLSAYLSRACVSCYFPLPLSLVAHVSHVVFLCLCLFLRICLTLFSSVFTSFYLSAVSVSPSTSLSLYPSLGVHLYLSALVSSLSALVSSLSALVSSLSAYLSLYTPLSPGTPFSTYLPFGVPLFPRARGMHAFAYLAFRYLPLIRNSFGILAIIRKFSRTPIRNLAHAYVHVCVLSAPVPLAE